MKEIFKRKIKMKKTNSLLSLLMIIYAVSSAQMTNTTDANIVGHVIDAATKKHIHYVTIAIKGTTIGTLSDASGHYYLKNLPLGEYTLVASYVGYVSVEKKVELIKGKTIEVNFELEEDVLSLNNVVVSANRNATNRQEAPSVVNVISPKMFENVQSLCLADGLNYQSGLRVESNCQNCGFPQVRINGLEGPYSQILIDSRAISSALAGVYGLEQIPVNMIERVEVVRGGGSATFGSNAIAGTINIITKEPKINAVCLKNTTQLIGFNAIDVNNTLNASVVSNKNKAGVTLFAGARQRGAYDANEDGFSEIGKINNKNLGMRGYWHLNDHGKLTFEYHTIREFRRGGNLLHLPAHEADIAEQTEHDIHTAGITYDLFLDNGKHWLQLYASLQHIDRQSYYGSGKDLNAYGTTKDLANVDGIQYVLSMKKCLFMPATLTSGMEISYNSLLDKMLGYNRTIDQKALIYSVFLQNEWSNRKLSLLVGARMDKHNLIQHPIVSPRLNLRYAPHKNITLRAGYVAGFRAPQAYDEDLHVTAVGGGVSLIRIDPDLKPERSNSVNASINFNKKFEEWMLDVLLEAFYTDLHHVFLLEEVGRDINDNLILERRNGSGASVKGFNLEGNIAPHKKINVQFGFTYQQSRYKKAEQWSESVEAQKIMFRSPDTYGFLAMVYEPTKGFDIALSGTYTGSMLIQHFAGYIPMDKEEQTPDFFDMNVKLSYDIELKEKMILQINGGMKNILNSYQKDFDKGELRDAGYIYGPSLPRTAFIGLSFNI